MLILIGTVLALVHIREFFKILIYAYSLYALKAYRYCYTTEEPTSRRAPRNRFFAWSHAKKLSAQLHALNKRTSNCAVIILSTIANFTSTLTLLMSKCKMCLKYCGRQVSKV